MITFPCQCGTLLKAKEESAGKQVRCPKCRTVMQVPADSSSGGSSSDAVAADTPSVNMPRLRSEVLRQSAPVTNVEASAPPEVVKVVAAVPSPEVEQVQPKAARPAPAPAPPLPPPAEAAPPIEPRLPKPRQAPPMPPRADVLAAPAVVRQPAAVARKEKPTSSAGDWSKTWWIGGGSAVIVLLVAVAFLIGRGSSQPPAEPVAPSTNETAASASPTTQERNRPAAQEEPRVEVASSPQTRPRPEEPRPRPRTRPPEDSQVEQPSPPPASPPSEPPPSKPPAARVVTQTPRPTAAPRSPGQLAGVSRKYDDLDCTMIQQQHSAPIPLSATMLEIDGQRLPLSNLEVLAECPAPCIYLPRGTHAVRFRPREAPVQVKVQTDLSQIYHEMRQFFDADGNIREVELLSRGAKCMDVHGAPFLLNLMGGVHLKKEQTAAAERKFRRALRVNPLFSPAHLNLAALLHKRGATKEARRELELADATNVGNCFGLSAAIASLRREMGLPQFGAPEGELPLSSYVTQESLTEEDRRLTALMQGLSKYAVQESERGKILNNLAVHFADTGRTELALDHFRSALEALKLAGTERYDLARKVLGNMSRVCRDANFDEAEEYERMQTLVRP